MLFLLALLILGIVWVASALIDNDAASMESLYGMLFKDSVSFVPVITCLWQNIDEEIYTHLTPVHYRLGLELQVDLLSLA